MSGGKIGMIVGLIGGLAGLAVGVVAMVDPGLLASAANKVLPGVKPQVQGSLVARGGDLGEWTLSPDACTSGEREGFFGVVLFKQGDNDHFVKLAKDPTTSATVLTVKIPGTDKARVIRSCKKLDGRVQRTSTRVNYIWSVAGSLEVECPGERLSGRVTFSNCH